MDRRKFLSSSMAAGALLAVPSPHFPATAHPRKTTVGGMENTGPQSLTLNVPTVVQSPYTYGGNPPAQVQIANASGFLLEASVGGLTYLVQAYTALTLPLTGDNQPLTMVPFSGAAVAPYNQVTETWLLDGEASPQLDGPLTAAAIAAAISGIAAISETQFLAVVQSPVGASASHNYFAIGFAYPAGLTSANFHSAIVSIYGTPGHLSGWVGIFDPHGNSDGILPIVESTLLPGNATVILPFEIGDTPAGAAIVVTNGDTADAITVDITLSQEAFDPSIGSAPGILDTAGRLIISPSSTVSLPAGQAVELLDAAGVNKAAISAAGAVSVAPPNPMPVSLPAGQAVELLDAGGVNKATISAGGAQLISGTVTANISPGTASARTSQSPGTASSSVQFGPATAQVAKWWQIWISIYTLTCTAIGSLVLELKDTASGLDIAEAELILPLTANFPPAGLQVQLAGPCDFPGAAIAGGIYTLKWSHTETASVCTGRIGALVGYQ